MKDLAVVIPVWNNYKYTNRVLKNLSKLPYSVILVDNNSEDETSKITSGDKLTVIRNDKNLGFAKACNIGFQRAANDFDRVLFLNNDIVVQDEDWIKDLLQYDGLSGPTVGCLSDEFSFVCEAGKFPSNGFYYMSGWCLSAKVETFAELTEDGDRGPFSEKFFAYFEDTDLSFRAIKKQIAFNKVKLSAKHVGRVTSKKLGTNVIYLQSKSIFMNSWQSKKEELVNAVRVHTKLERS
jgi:GT2 family glycosyltransferase